MLEMATPSTREGGIHEARRAMRFACVGKAELFLDTSGSVMLGELRDMSEFGCMIVTRARSPIEVGMVGHLFFVVRGKQYRIASTVRNVRPGTGRCVGLEFSFESETHRSEYNQLFYDITTDPAQLAAPAHSAARPAVATR